MSNLCNLLTGKPVKPSASPLVMRARTYIGTAYRHRGRTARGLDCAGLPWLCYADEGVLLPDLTRYGREPHQDGLMRAVVDALGEPVWRGHGCPRDVLAVGDVPVLAFVREPHHLAIVGEDEMFGLSLIHADGTLGVSKVVEHGISQHFLDMIVAVCRRPV